MAKNCRVKEVAILQSSNKFEVLRSRVMQIREERRKEVGKNRRTIWEKKKMIERQEEKGRHQEKL